MDTNENPYATPTYGGEPVEETHSKSYKSFALASLWQRFAGSVIDSIVLVGVIIPIYIALVFLAETIRPGYVDLQETFPIVIFENILAIVVMVVVFLLVHGYLLAKQGQTVGKLIMKTRIVSDAGELLPLSRLFLMRYLLIWCVGIIPLAGGIITLINPLLIFRGNRKCLHDDWAGTKVVKTVRTPGREPLPEKIEIPEVETAKKWGQKMGLRQEAWRRGKMK